jgi:hypothetical protein
MTELLYNCLCLLYNFKIFLFPSRHWRLILVILATWEAEFGRIEVWGQQNEFEMWLKPYSASFASTEALTSNLSHSKEKIFFLFHLFSPPITAWSLKIFQIRVAHGGGTCISWFFIGWASFQPFFGYSSWFFFFEQYQGLNSGPCAWQSLYHLSHSPSLCLFTDPLIPGSGLFCLAEVFHLKQSDLWVSVPFRHLFSWSSLNKGLYLQLALLRLFRSSQCLSHSLRVVGFRGRVSPCSLGWPGTC